MKKAILLAGAVSLLLLAGCSKKAGAPGEFSMVPADADIVGVLDAKSVMDYVKGVAPKLVPAELKDQIPPIETLLQQAMQMTGIDLNKLGRVIFVGYAGSDEKMAFFAEGIEANGIAGYAKDLDDAKKNPRVAGNPLIVKAKAPKKEGSCDIVLSSEEAKKLKSRKDLSFLGYGRVMIVTDAE